MKITVTKKSKVQASSRVIRASRSTADMLEAFEDKLAEFGIEACDKVTASTGDPEMDDIMEEERAVEIYGEDYHDRYEDVGGGFGGLNEDDVYTLAEIKKYWNEANMSDPSLESYDSFDSWWRDTRDNYMIEASTDVFDSVTEGELDAEEVESIDGGCSIQGSIKYGDLSEEQEHLLDLISDRYNTSHPVSGNWDTETEHEAYTIAEELGIDIRDAVDIMREYLGFEDDELATIQF